MAPIFCKGNGRRSTDDVSIPGGGGWLELGTSVTVCSQVLIGEEETGEWHGLSSHTHRLGRSVHSGNLGQKLERVPLWNQEGLTKN